MRERVAVAIKQGCDIVARIAGVSFGRRQEGVFDFPFGDNNLNFSCAVLCAGCVRCGFHVVFVCGVFVRAKLRIRIFISSHLTMKSFALLQPPFLEFAQHNQL